MDIKFLRTTEGNTKDSIRNETFREEIWIQNLYQSSKRNDYSGLAKKKGGGGGP
jgi:hypothetical protein